MLSTITRRAAIGAIAAIPATAATGRAFASPEALEHPEGLSLALAAGPDAALLALGAEFEAAWKLEREAAEFSDANLTDETSAVFDRCFEACSDLVDRIKRMPARTIDGLQVKARAICWCWSSSEEEALLTDLGDTTDNQLASAIVRDLLEIRRAAA